MRRALAGIATVGTLAGLVAVAPEASAAKPAPPPPSPTSTVEFQNATYNVSESIGLAPVRIVRTKGDATKDAWVTVGSSNGTAVSPADYTDTSTAYIKLPAGSNTVDFLVPIVDDLIDENSETVNLTLYSFISPDPATMPAAQLGKRKAAKLTINDNDAAPKLSVADDTTNEGNLENFGVSLSAVSGLPVTFTWGTAQTSTGPPKDATSGVDYTAFAGQTATIPAGQTFKNIAVGTLQDAIYEDNQTFKMVVSNASNASILDGTGVGTIIDNDSAPVLSIGNAWSAPENAGPINVLVTKTGASEFPASAKLTTTDGNAAPSADGVCASPEDYLQLVGQTVVVPAGQPSVTVPVSLCDDAIPETNETFAVYLTDPSIATIDPLHASGIATIVDDEAAQLSFSPGSQTVAPNAEGHTVTVRNSFGDIIPTPTTVHFEVWRDRDSNDYYDFIVGADQVVAGTFSGSYPGGAPGDEDVVVACIVTAAAGDTPACGIETDTLIDFFDFGDVRVGEDTTLDFLGILFSPITDYGNVVWTS
jgi:hypothetical protein